MGSKTTEIFYFVDDVYKEKCSCTKKTKPDLYGRVLFVSVMYVVNTVPFVQVRSNSYGSFYFPGSQSSVLKEDTGKPSVPKRSPIIKSRNA